MLAKGVIDQASDVRQVGYLYERPRGYPPSSLTTAVSDPSARLPADVGRVCGALEQSFLRRRSKSGTCLRKRGRG